jgi:hypothetical protein
MMAAFGITAPVESETVPVKVPRLVCPDAAITRTKKQITIEVDLMSPS